MAWFLKQLILYHQREANSSETPQFLKKQRPDKKRKANYLMAGENYLFWNGNRNCLDG
jgi:hypothetical protein